MHRIAWQPFHAAELSPIRSSRAGAGSVSSRKRSLRPGSVARVSGAGAVSRANSRGASVHSAALSRTQERNPCATVSTPGPCKRLVRTVWFSTRPAVEGNTIPAPSKSSAAPFPVPTGNSEGSGEGGGRPLRENDHCRHLRPGTPQVAEPGVDRNRETGGTFVPGTLRKRQQAPHLIGAARAGAGPGTLRKRQQAPHPRLPAETVGPAPCLGTHPGRTHPFGWGQKIRQPG